MRQNKNTDAFSYRRLRVANLIQEALEEMFLLGKHLDDRLTPGSCAFTHLDISPDLKLVTCCFIPSVVNKLSVDQLMEAFENSKFAIRKTITSKIALKFSPEFRFLYDHGADNALRVNKVLEKDF